MKDLLHTLWIKKWRLLAPVVVLVMGFMATTYLLETRPGARRAPPVEAQPRLVQVTVAKKENHRVVIEAYGEVVPRSEVSVKAQVSGQVVAIGPQLLPGGRLAKGDLIVQIEPRDYQLAVQRAESTLAKAKSALAREQGNQNVAREEYQFLGEDLTGAERDLVLRRPQLKSAEADVEAAQAALDEAKLDLERTKVVAPFNAMVTSKNVDVGTRLSSADVIAKLVGTESYWVELALPTNELRWLDVPTNRRRDPTKPGEAEQMVRSVRLFNSSSWGDQQRHGTLVRVLGDLTSEGRMAKVLVQIDDPLALKDENMGQPVVLLGSYLRAEVDGRMLENVVELDRALVRQSGHVWVVDPDNRLELRQVNVVFSDKDHVYIDKGLETGDRVVTTDVPTAAPGLPVRISGNSSEILGQKGNGHDAGA